MFTKVTILLFKKNNRYSVRKCLMFRICCLALAQVIFVYSSSSVRLNMSKQNMSFNFFHFFFVSYCNLFYFICTSVSMHICKYLQLCNIPFEMQEQAK